MKLIVYSAHDFEIPYLKKYLESSMEVTYVQSSLDENTCHLSNKHNVAALFTSDKADKNILNNLYKQGIRFITLRSAGFDHVDLIEAKNLNIKVANVPAYSPYAIAEHAVTLLLALNRKIYQSQLLMQLQDFRIDPLVGFDIHGKTVGIIGTGKIGMAFASIMKGFGTNIIAYDIVQNKSASDIGIKYVNFQDLLKHSDIISIHCPLNENTKHLISNEEFSLMKSNTILINTARGAIVDTMALIDALQTKRIAGAALDVYEYEKGLFFNDYRNQPIKDRVFLQLKSMTNVLITGHQAFLTQEALNGIAETTYKNIEQWKSRGACDNDLN